MSLQSETVDNYEVLLKSPSPLDVVDFYNKWTGYDEDLSPVHYRGPPVLATTILKYVSDKIVHILDVAAGSGFLALELEKLGYKGSMDGLDPATEFAKQAIETGRYKDFYYDFITEKPCSIAEGSFDHVACCGGLIPGHIHFTGIREMLRLCKKGGYVFIAMRHDFINEGEQLSGLDDYVKDLISSGICNIVERFVFERYFYENEGLVIVLKKN
ncbi:uncharacterized protein LOC141905359 [Tubulanus polymorphus]|uniref:uncharacterized protein LOC141905359 n=1 Tax=Tubulanus polymorphus TaxID=672921 RepID=UPI003DA5A5BF